MSRTSLIVACLALCACCFLSAATFQLNEDKRELSARVARLESAVVSQVWEREFEAGRLSLPNDANQWHTVLIVNRGWQNNGAQRAAVTMFDSNATLSALKKQTHWHLICAEDPEFKKFRACVDAVPCLIVERPSGQVIYRESGEQLGLHQQNLVHAMRKEVERHCPDGKCLPLHPVPDAPKPPAVPDVPPSAVVTPPPAVPPKQDNTLAAVALAALSAAGGFAIKFRKAAGF